MRRGQFQNPYLVNNFSSQHYNGDGNSHFPLYSGNYSNHGIFVESSNQALNADSSIELNSSASGIRQHGRGGSRGRGRGNHSLYQRQNQHRIQTLNSVPNSTNAVSSVSSAPIQKNKKNGRKKFSLNKGTDLTIVSTESVSLRHANIDNGAVGRVFCNNNTDLRSGRNSFALISQRDTLIQQLSACEYECMVCCSRIRRDVAIWSCDSCYNMFHLFCIKKWARALRDESLPTTVEMSCWRCPACQKEHTTSVGFRYQCFCGKVSNPDLCAAHTPHSCGELCGRSRGLECVHACSLLCHPGPCPTCEALVQRRCPCGRTESTVRCSKAAALKCSATCARLLNCGRHTCQQACHSDLCAPCEQLLEQKCHCGKESRQVVCGTRESFSSSFSCNKPCANFLDCKNHTCKDICHAGPCAECELLPSRLSRCPCGQHALDELLAAAALVRSSCLDAVPTCDDVCLKKLKCGGASTTENDSHVCLALCHAGDCPPCARTTELTCRCTAQRKKVPCSELRSFGSGGAAYFLCQKRCKKKRRCGKHQCGEQCCVQTEHVCPMVCGRQLTCGQHQCEQLCHLGHCAPCYHASFDELTCTCGHAVLYPPVACGTKPPRCNRPCSREHICGHAPQHECHSDVTCPLCPVLVSKHCNGGHTTLNNIRCHVDNVSCGQPCGRELPCSHRCPKICHRGECLSGEEATAQCRLPCQQTRAECGHVCGAPCHVGQTDCPRVVCRQAVQVHCKCGLLKQTMLCFEMAEVVRVALETNAAAVDLSQLAEMRRAKQIPCDSTCAIYERNRRMAEALNLQNADVSQNLAPPTYSRFLLDFASQYSLFALGIENKLEDALKSVLELGQAVRHVCLDAMPREKRRFVHELAEYYGCESWSSQSDPNRSVTVTFKRGRATRPSVKLSTMMNAERQVQAKPNILKPMATTLQTMGPGGSVGSGFMAAVAVAQENGGPTMQSLGKTLSRAVGSGSAAAAAAAATPNSQGGVSLSLYAHRAAKPDFSKLGAAALEAQCLDNEDFDYFDMKPRSS